MRKVVVQADTAYRDVEHHSLFGEKKRNQQKKTTTYALQEESKIFKCQAGELSLSKHPFELFSSDAYSEYYSGSVSFCLLPHSYQFK